MLWRERRVLFGKARGRGVGVVYKTWGAFFIIPGRNAFRNMAWFIEHEQKRGRSPRGGQ